MLAFLEKLWKGPVWVMEMKIRHLGGNPPHVICATAKNLKTSKTINMSYAELRQRKECPFSTGKDSLVVTFKGAAVCSGFHSLAWSPPSRLLDLFTEYRKEFNGRLSAKMDQLFDALTTYKIGHTHSTNAHELQRLILSRKVLTVEEQKRVMAFNMEDVLSIEKLLYKMMPRFNLNPILRNQALLRGRYMKNVGMNEHRGIHIDNGMYKKICENRLELRKMAIERSNLQYDIFEDGLFSYTKFYELLRKYNIKWPLNDNGFPKFDKDTLKEMKLKYPMLEGLYDAINMLTCLRKFELDIGKDDRARCHIRPFASITARNQPPTSKYIFGMNSFLHSLVIPPKGMSVVSLDWKQHEFITAGALSGDKAMIADYKQGDAYSVFAKRTGLITACMSKKERIRGREKAKISLLGFLNGMSALKLATVLGCSDYEAREILKLIRRRYKHFSE